MATILHLRVEVEVEVGVRSPGGYETRLARVGN
jgi:hypothetical protein